MRKIIKDNIKEVLTVTLVFHLVFEFLLLQNGKIS